MSLFLQFYSWLVEIMWTKFHERNLRLSLASEIEKSIIPHVKEGMSIRVFVFYFWRGKGDKRRGREKTPY